MIRFSNAGCGTRRSWLSTGLLVLIIFLLTLDTGDRKPFLRNCVVTTCNVVRTMTDWACSFADSDPSANPGQNDSADPPQFDTQSRSDAGQADAPAVENAIALPVDFLFEMERELQRSSSITARELWNRMLRSPRAERQADLAILLAIELEPTVWTVSGNRVREEELHNHLGNPQRTVLY